MGRVARYKKPKKVGSEVKEREVAAPRRPLKPKRSRDQHLPKSLRNFTAVVSDAAAGKMPQRARRDDGDGFAKRKGGKGAATTSAKAPGGTDGGKLAMRSGESIDDFNRRVEDAARSDIYRMARKKTRKAQKRDAFYQTRKTDGGTMPEVMAATGDPDATPEEVRQAKQTARSIALENKSRTDHVAFGEVAMAPPTLTAKPRLRGKKRGEQLLLQKQLDKTQPATVGEEAKSSKNKEEHAHLRGTKRSKMSDAEKRIHDDNRENAIQEYRRLQKEKAAA